jgi:hypothetical protein
VVAYMMELERLGLRTSFGVVEYTKRARFRTSGERRKHYPRRLDFGVVFNMESQVAVHGAMIAV